MIRLLFRETLIFITVFFICCSGSCQSPGAGGSQMVPGAEQPELYLRSLENQPLALVINQTSLVDDEPLIDFLLSHKINVKKVFAAEHGFRGGVEAGEKINDAIDLKTGIPVVSLYGEKKKPAAKDMEDIELVVFDIQDVGCRFFTYISTLHYLMEACAENDKKLIVLDRPNPNGDYIDGPVLDTAFSSFVGMHPIPVVHGCTVGELALMINGERWLKGGRICDLTVIPVKNYTHMMHYSLPVKPSPNLTCDRAVRLYPSLCLFEATNVSIGRGTRFPFQVIGFPQEGLGPFTFIPVSIEGMSKNPLQANQRCYGDDLRNLDPIPRFTLSFFLDYYKRIGDEERFWNSRRWMGLLMGQDQFYLQVSQGWDEMAIRASWADGLKRYREMRKKYLLYPDFE